MSEKQVLNNTDAHRYELVVDGEVAGYAEYNEAATGIVLTHTEVLPAHEGKGYAGTLAKGVLDDVRAHGKQVIPVCHFMAGYIRKHREYHDLVNPETRKAFNA